MRAVSRQLIRVTALLLASVCLGEPPKDLGLVERTERTLVQLSVRVRPLTFEYRVRASHLTKDDFSVVLDDREIPADQFALDNYCPEPAADRPPETQDSPKHLLFFVDALGPNGRDNTMAMLQAMIPRMAADGYAMRVLPGGSAGWTQDVGRLLRDAGAAVDPTIPTADEGGSSPEAELRALLEANEVDRAIDLAGRLELAAQLTFAGPTMQLARAISEMGPLPMAKALIYFAESGHSFREMIVDTAIRAGVAVYAVKADGLAPYVPNLKTVTDPGAIITTSLSALSEHTGGRFSLGHFRRSASDAVMKRVESDLSCVYVISLDAAGLERDRTLRPKIRLNSTLRSHFVAETIPDFTIPSERRRQEEAVAVTLRSGGGPGVQPAGVSFVPVGFDGTQVSGLIQFTLGSALADRALTAAWDVGINYFGAARVSGHGGIRVATDGSNVVFEKIAQFPIGPYSIVGVAQEVGGPGLARGTAAGLLSRPKRSAVGFLHTPDIVQRRAGTFVAENGNTRTEGWTAIRFGMAASDRPTSVVTSLCRGPAVRGTLTIERRLFLPNDELRIQASPWPEEKTALCRVLRDDLVEADTLPWSDKPYEASLVLCVSDAAGRTIAKSSQSFWVIGPHR